MQAGVREEELKLNAMKQALAVMSKLKKLVLGMYFVSLSGLDD